MDLGGQKDASSKWGRGSVEGTFAGSASGDIDGDGRDEALFTVGQTLYCYGTDSSGKTGVEKWRIDLPARMGPPVITDVDGDGLAEILVQGADGVLYAIK